LDTRHTFGEFGALSLAFSRETLMELARSRSTADREQLLFALADLCEAEAGAGKIASSPVQELLGSLFMSLVVEAERDIRARLAEKLARAEWAPSALVNVLALDEIEIARPIIAQSPVLKDHDLVRLLVEATIEHQIAVSPPPDAGRAGGGRDPAPGGARRADGAGQQRLGGHQR
jgi:uncharacterized protein (DUF2336 family)